MPPEQGWQPLDAFTRASPEEPGEAPWGDAHGWHVVERRNTWQSRRTWLGKCKEDLRAPCQAACPVGTNAGLYVSLIFAKDACELPTVDWAPGARQLDAG
ncbi:MAG TPA: hypothetical protein VGN32_17780 [Ktedonobacterales bacterium]|nr:hypothetical protein [Ktedonobacterales bacterium]